MDTTSTQLAVYLRSLSPPELTHHIQQQKAEVWQVLGIHNAAHAAASQAGEDSLGDLISDVVDSGEDLTNEQLTLLLSLFDSRRQRATSESVDLHAIDNRLDGLLGELRVAQQILIEHAH